MVFWYNLHPNEIGDRNTRHAACPVLSGQKLVSNKWIHARGQEWTRPCGLNQNDQSTLIIPGFDRHRSFDYDEIPF